MRTGLRLVWGLGLVGLVPLLAVLLLAWNGAMGPPVALGLPDPGALTRWGLPVFRGLRDVSATLTVGFLVLAAVAVPPDAETPSGKLGPVQLRLAHSATLAGFLWCLAGWMMLVLTYADLSGTSPFGSGISGQITFFATNLDLGRSLLASLLLTGVVTVGSILAIRVGTVGVLALLSLGALWPLAFTGHAAGSSNHDAAVNAQAAHLVGVSVWVGGLAALAMARRQLGDRFGPVASRYSTLAGCCFAVVALSGTVQAVLRVPSWSGMLSDYGVLLTAKILALCLLGAAGWHQRRRILPALAADAVGSGRAFGKLAAVELTVMALALGTAVALSRTPPPPTGSDGSITAAESLLESPLPPALGVAEWFTQWRIDTFWTPLALFVVGSYLVGVRRLRRRGDRWPVGRTVAWVLGCLMLVWATSGSPGVYGEVLFSMHMVQHMTVATAVPVFLVLGAPVTLALRTLPRREDASRGPREWLLALVHSSALRVLGHPLVAAGLFIASLVAFYYSPLFELSLRSQTAHLLMIFHFLASGYLFASVICGIDPGPARPAYPFRVLLLLVTFGFHAFFSVSLMSSEQLLAEPWFSALGRTWGNSLEQDQYLGASIGWALGDYPLGILAVALVWAWVKADNRESRRYDREADRTGDIELAAYNEQLKRLAERGKAPRE